ncbi:BQ5605_C002g01805 [Microbotryum silenes-dioicae]|uniref:BQ5605_C002g01805 protein n=1 Tax=Microbotryum silenes-dioicae TaxID=796604 RepID=A0A2X0MLS2_9BASI|nr:BQ5605_C002g01805 [Microbotryum silenes-dioicae]
MTVRRRGQNFVWRPLLCRSTNSNGADLHLFHVGHEYMGIIEQVGSSVQGLQPGDRVIASFDVTCGDCYMCNCGLTSDCQQSNSSNLMNAFYGNRIVGLRAWTVGIFSLSSFVSCSFRNARIKMRKWHHELRIE